MKAYRLATTDMNRKPLLHAMAVAAPRLFAFTHFGKSKKHFPSPSLHLSQILTHNSIHHLQQQQQRNQQWKRTFTTSSTFSSSNSNDGKNQDAIPLSALNNETNNTSESERQDIATSVSGFDLIRSDDCVYVDKTQQIYETLLKKRAKMYFFRSSSSFW